MSNNINHKRREKLFIKTISDIIQFDLTNANLSFTTIVDGKLSKDGRHLKIYVNFENKKNQSLEVLNISKGFIKKQIALKINPRIVPDIEFIYDQTSDNARRIEEILKKINQEKK